MNIGQRLYGTRRDVDSSDKSADHGGMAEPCTILTSRYTTMTCLIERLEKMLDQVELAAEFPQDGQMIYLNHAGVAPWPSRTHDAVRQFATENIIYGASRYPNWTKKETELRSQLMKLINAPSIDDIALLKSTSEGLSVVASGLKWQAGDNIVGIREEFPSNRIPWQAQSKHGVAFREVNLGGDNPEMKLMSACDDRTRMMTVSSVQYISGLRLDLTRLGKFCRQENILFCVDAIQSLGALSVDAQEIMADFLVADAHKWMLGPEGIALFYCREDVRDELQLFQYGWHMVENSGDFEATTWRPAVSARRFECGSPNMLGVHAFSASLGIIQEAGIKNIERIILKNTIYLIDKLDNIKNITIMTPRQPNQHSGIVSFSINHRNNLYIHKLLMEKGVICALRGGCIRFSPHFYISQSKIDKTLEILQLTIG